MRCESVHKGLQCERNANHDGVHEAANVDNHSWSWWQDSPGTVPGQTVDDVTPTKGTPPESSSEGSDPGPGGGVESPPARVSVDEPVERLLRRVGEEEGT